MYNKVIKKLKKFIYSIRHKEKKISDIQRRVIMLKKANAEIIAIQDEMIERDPSLKRFRFLQEY